MVRISVSSHLNYFLLIIFQIRYEKVWRGVRIPLTLPLGPLLRMAEFEGRWRGKGESTIYNTSQTVVRQVFGLFDDCSRELLVYSGHASTLKLECLCSSWASLFLIFPVKKRISKFLFLFLDLWVGVFPFFLLLSHVLLMERNLAEHNIQGFLDIIIIFGCRNFEEHATKLLGG